MIWQKFIQRQPQGWHWVVCASTNRALALEDAQLTGLSISWSRDETKENGSCLSLRSGKDKRAQRKDKIESSVNSRPLAPEPSARHAFGDMTTQGVSWELQERQWVRGGEGKDWLSGPCILWWWRQPATLWHTHPGIVVGAIDEKGGRKTLPDEGFVLKAAHRFVHRPQIHSLYFRAPSFPCTHWSFLLPQPCSCI